MQQAISAGRRARGVSNPNPPVGAVVVVDDVVVGEGWTGPPGEPHAEVHALNRAGAISRGATMYVTLEPCCHTGRSGPCTDAIINSGISQVYVAVEDPDARVSGGGISVLRQNGIEVVVGELQEEVSIDLESHLKLSATGFASERIFNVKSYFSLFLVFEKYLRISFILSNKFFSSSFLNSNDSGPK